jgi:hypothetical protein
MALTAPGCPRVSHPVLLPGKMLAPASKSGETQISSSSHHLRKRLSLTPCTILSSGVKMMLLGPRGCTEWREDILSERSAGAKACAELHMSSAASARMEELPVG